MNITKVNFPKSLQSCTHVFVRRDAVKKPLQPPYDGPYKVLDRQDKYFKLWKTDTFSVDRLKPAHLEIAPSTADQTVTSPTTTAPPVDLPAPAYTPSYSSCNRTSYPRHSINLHAKNYTVGKRSILAQEVGSIMCNLSTEGECTLLHLNSHISHPFMFRLTSLNTFFDVSHMHTLLRKC